MTRSGFNARAVEAMGNRRMIAAIQAATLKKHQDRIAAWAELPELGRLREEAARIKRETLDHLDEYLGQFTERVEAAGGRVHYAESGTDAVSIVTRIAHDAKAGLCVQAKSMTAEEVRLRPALESTGIRVVETDLGEFIAQIDNDRPSHIVTPIIHKDRASIAKALTRETGGAYTEDPAELTRLARKHLRDVFRKCDMGISGVNFAVADTGTICVCTNEGNGRFVVSRPPIHVAVMGIEKLIPRLADLSVFLRLLARSATGQAVTVYTSLITGTRHDGDRDGPRELHVVMLDGGRRRILAGPFREALSCIRCGACLNDCPVYRSVGGHAYGTTYPGPIGKVISPLLRPSPESAELAGASSLCGACREACPVGIDIPQLLIEHRNQAVRTGKLPWRKRWFFRAVFMLMLHARLYRLGQRAARSWLVSRACEGWVERLGGPLAGWTSIRDVPVPAERSFGEWWRSQVPAPDEGLTNRRDMATAAERAMPRRSVAADDTNDRLTRGSDSACHPLELFSVHVEAAGAEVRRVSEAELPTALADLLAGTSAERIVCDRAVLHRWESLKPTLGSAVCFPGGPDEELFAAEAGVTLARWGVAETGSIVCLSTPNCSSVTSLVPPAHFAILEVNRIVADWADLFEELGKEGLAANVSVITGPSKTADIQGRLVQGVHGPGRLGVIVVA